jgi:hypothetical protein
MTTSSDVGTATSNDLASRTGSGLGADASLPVRLTRRLEETAALDGAQRLPQAVADTLLSPPALRDALRGKWLGHALHPLLTDLPLGAWTSATLLDLAGGPNAHDDAAQLVAFGVVTALPTAVTGLAEWGSLTGPQRRVGLVHAATNTFALTLYGASLLARRRNRHRAGVLLALAGGAAATVPPPRVWLARHRLTDDERAAP